MGRKTCKNARGVRRCFYYIDRHEEQVTYSFLLRTNVALLCCYSCVMFLELRNIFLFQLNKQYYDVRFFGFVFM